MMILYEWHPLVLPGDNEIKIKKKLLQKSFEFAKLKGISNIRTFIDVVVDRQEEFKELQNTLLSVNMDKTHVCYCMEHDFSKKDIKHKKVPEGMAVTPLIKHEKDKLLVAYNKIFENSYDDFINSLDEEEKSYWDFFNLGRNSEASTILEHNGNIVGFVGARDYGEYIEFGPVGILPEYRGKGLSKVLMDYTIQNLITMNKTASYIEVGEPNKSAFELYSSYGFREVSKKHGFVMRLKEVPNA
jgi:ribosomal protein S18 acetylase RimI-like enzyme